MLVRSKDENRVEFSDKFELLADGNEFSEEFLVDMVVALTEHTDEISNMQQVKRDETVFDWIVVLRAKLRLNPNLMHLSEISFARLQFLTHSLYFQEHIEVVHLLYQFQASLKPVNIQTLFKQNFILN